MGVGAGMVVFWTLYKKISDFGEGGRQPGAAYVPHNVQCLKRYPGDLNRLETRTRLNFGALR